MAFPTTSVLDDFNRANAALNDGSIWRTTAWDGNPVRIISNQAGNTGSGVRGSYYIAQKFDLTVGVEVGGTITVKPTGSQSVWFNMYLNGNDATPDGYELVIGTNTVEIIRFRSGNETSLVSRSVTWSAGDTWGLEVVGGVLTAYLNGVAQATARDSNYTTDLVHLVLSQQGTTSRVDDFFGGEIVAGDTTPPTVTLSGISATRISRVSGKDVTRFTITADENFVQYSIRSVPSSTSPHTAGDEIEGNTVSSTNSLSVDVTDDELTATGAGEGTYVIKAFVADAAGNWST